MLILKNFITFYRFFKFYLFNILNEYISYFLYMILGHQYYYISSIIYINFLIIKTHIIYNKLIFKLMKRIPKNCYAGEEGNILGLKEDEEAEEANYILKKNKKGNKNLKKIQNVIGNSAIIEKQKILYLLINGDKKGYELNNSNKIYFNNIFGKNNINKLNYNNNLLNIDEDICQPYSDTCFKIDLNKTKIIFVDNNTILKKYYGQYFKKSLFCGVDSEWREGIYPNEFYKSSILQIANYDEDCIFIIDLQTIENDKKFLDEFLKYFNNKKYIGYDFNRSDISRLNTNIQNIFNNNNIIDIIQIYQLKYLEKCDSLSKLSQKFFKKELYKISQCSNWDIRPLSKRQIHYAALDAMICIKLYKQLLNK